MAGVKYEDVAELLLDRFPEFKETAEYQTCDPEFAYSVWGNFGSYVTDYMRALPADELDDDPMVGRVFDLANELMDSDDPDTQTIVVIELFENFYSWRTTLELARRKLKKRHLTWLERQGMWLRTSG